MRRPTRLPSLALALSLGLAAVLAVPAAADTRLEMKSHTDAYQMMGQAQPAEDSEVTLWIADDRVLRDDGESALLYRGDQDRLYVIDHRQESYSVVELPVDLLALMPPETRAQMEGFVEQMAMVATVEPTDERKEIHGWSARRYDVAMSNAMGMAVDSTVWATDEIDADLEAFRGLYAAMGSLQPGGASALEELLKVQGIPVLTETTVQGMGSSFSSTEEVVAAEQAEAPAGTYEVPEGYTETPFNPMGQGR